MDESRAVTEVNARIVYWGVAGAGKRTNLRVIHAKLRPDHRGDLRELPTRLDPTVTYCMLPIELGEVSGVRTRIQVLTAPSGPDQAPTRKQLLDRVDGVVFVADSQIERMDANIEAMQNLYENMTQHGYDVTKLPFAIQYNKRDLPNAAPIAELQSALNPGWPVSDSGKQRVTPDPYHDSEFLVNQEDGHWIERAPYFEAVALTGEGVFDTLKAISKTVVKTLG